MTVLMAAIFAAILAMGMPGTIGLTPEGAYEAGLLDGEPPPCRELSRAERRERSIDPKGKAATYSIDGEFVCERRIFDYGDRDSYTDFVAEHAEARASAIALRVAALIASTPELTARTWFVEAEANEAPLDAYVTRVFRHALVRTLGSGKVGAQSADDAARLFIETFAVQDDDILFRASVSVTQAGETTTWAL